MIRRLLADQLFNYLQRFPAVALLGCRQVGKTTLALAVQEQSKKPATYLDLELPRDRAKLTDPELYLQNQEGRLVILDEVQRIPELFAVLRGVIDQRRRKGETAEQFLILGSASAHLLRQSSESLAGRIAYLELNPFNWLEVATKKNIQTLNKLWLRGGFPDSFLSQSDEESFQWREQFIRTYLERDLPQLGTRLPADRVYRLWKMLAFDQGCLLNLSRLASSLSVSATTVRHYLDILSDIFLVRQLKPWHGNSKKRLVKSPKIYIRDSGITHALVGIQTLDHLLNHSLCGPSWEGFVIEQIFQRLPQGTEVYFYRSSAGAEIDVVLESLKDGKTAIEIKRTLAPVISKGFKLGCEEIKVNRRFYVIPHGESYALDADTKAISIMELLESICE